MDVTPDKQNINALFSNTTYYIDFYQRQYKWDRTPVKRLLDDVFYKFNIEYEKFKDDDRELPIVIKNYSWYYLNTYVTNRVDGKLYVVDGQQRLTTLTLILLKLYNMAKSSAFDSPLKDWISSKIVGQTGFEKEFWMNHEQHKVAMQDLLDGKPTDEINTQTGITAVNMVNNYEYISERLDETLLTKEKFETFVFYFLERLVLINLNVEQTDVPMIFEVINDRGVRLKPYEILKGKLLGQINKDELTDLRLNELWDEQIDTINQLYDDGVDDFFKYYLRAKFANSIGDSRKYDKNYHRVIFEKQVNEQLKLDHNPKAVKSFLRDEFKYYTDLYIKLLDYHDNPQEDYMHVYYNYLTDMDAQFILILSACNLNDEQEDEKIKLISFLVDRFYSLLQLQKSYDSNDFNEKVYEINKQIRGVDNLDDIVKIFNNKLIEVLSENRGSHVDNTINYNLFRDTGNELNKRFKRYFFARIEKFIADNTELQMKHSLYDLVRNTGSINGFHIEHILSMNEDNFALFGNNEERFESERNRLGGLLLLKGRDNISSSNESYNEKLKTYSNTLYWNETLREDNYKSKLDFNDFQRKFNLTFRPMKQFGPEQLDERQQLLFDMVNIIWNAENQLILIKQ